MELDKRIMSGKKPLDCFDAEQARNFVGKKCYLTNDISLFSDLNAFKDIKGCNEAIYEGVVDTLTNINTEVTLIFETTYLRWKFCIPCEWVKEEKKEPKYRPYTLAEWIGQHAIGDVIRYRCKSQKIELRHLYVGYGYGIGTDIKHTTSGTLTLGVASYTLDYLLEDYEIEVNGEWLPFGILEE